MRERPGFSLIELVIVVVILAVVGAIAMGRYGGFAERAKVNAAIANLQAFERGASRYLAEHGALPAAGMSGVLPGEFEDYINRAQFEAPAIGGGEYSWQNSGTVAGIAVIAGSPDTVLWKAIDARLDDGDASSGKVLFGFGILGYFVYP